MRIGTLATVAQRRLAYVRFTDGKFCAEPSPDAVDNLSATLSAALSTDTKSVGAAANIAASMASYAKQLLYRSQGLQLYRDGMFALCNAHLNGLIDQASFLKVQDDLLKTADKLITAEIPVLKDIKADAGGSPTPATPPVITTPTPSGSRSAPAPAQPNAPPAQ